MNHKETISWINMISAFVMIIIVITSTILLNTNGYSRYDSWSMLSGFLLAIALVQLNNV